ncbi:MAG: hypothetical protein KC964_11855 [Candidatus Omnitrophica bacterium]|nr:hypothetical protein [Candidatus Omnitrophota bacterium]
MRKIRGGVPLLEPHPSPRPLHQRDLLVGQAIEFIHDGIDLAVGGVDPPFEDFDRGRESALVCASPPSEPDVRFSRIRLSGRWFTA